jgi:hypothetical protein
VRLVTTRVAAGRPLLVARAFDSGAGVDPLSLVIAYKRVLVGAALYDPFSGLALFPLPRQAPALTRGRTAAALLASDYQEAKNIETLGDAVLPNSAFVETRVRVVNGPAVTWLLPDKGDCVGKREVLLATASSPRAVRTVSFLADGKPLGRDSGAGGLYAVTWRTSRVAKGRHVLSAIVTDAAGRHASARRAVRVCRR